jgi:drug/metabolite transporter (DMT)-like permease
MASLRTQRYIAFALVYLIWGSTYLAIRYAIDTIPPFLMAGSRFLLAGAILFTWARFKEGVKPTRRHWRNTGIIGLLLLLGGNGGVSWAEQTVPSGITALLVAIVPLWLVLLDWLRPGGKRPGIGTIAGVIVGLVGVVELVGIDAFRGNGTVDLVGAGVLVLGSLAWAAGSLFAKQADLPSAFLTTGMEMLIGGAALLLTGFLTGEHRHFALHDVSAVSVFGFFYLVTFGSLVAYTAYTWLVRHAAPAAVGTYAYVNAVVAVFLGWLIAHEPVTRNTIIGATIIVAAVAIITTTQASEKAG